MLGWGMDASKKYWVAENSWGAAWGENQNFQKCSVQDCRGPLCQSSDNMNPDCKDSSVWRDEFGNGCDWYAHNDQGCKVYPDSGQMMHCRNSCRNCLPPSLQDGEICGYFRFRRGQNHLGIEAAAMHTYVAGHAPPERVFATLEGTCVDDLHWVDISGKSCSWYRQQDPGCTKHRDVGQRAFCRKSC